MRRVYCPGVTTSTNRSESTRYRARLEEALRGKVLGDQGQFNCGHAVRCSASASRKGFGFAGGQLSYIGDSYACDSDGHPFRVLVVSMQVGDAEAPVDMERRSAQIAVRIRQRPGERNPHMRGVTRALQILHGLTVGPDDEWLADGTHVLRAYAMANSTLCSCLPTGAKSRRGKPTEEMLRNCSSHLLATLLALEPTIIQAQGIDTAAVVERLATAVDRQSANVARVSIGGLNAVLCSTSHPSSGPPSSWSSLKPGSYFADVCCLMT